MGPELRAWLRHACQCNRPEEVHKAKNCGECVPHVTLKNVTTHKGHSSFGIWDQQPSAGLRLRCRSLGHRSCASSSSILTLANISQSVIGLYVCSMQLSTNPSRNSGNPHVYGVTGHFPEGSRARGLLTCGNDRRQAGRKSGPKWRAWLRHSF